MEAEFNHLNHATLGEFDLDRAERRTEDTEFSLPQILGRERTLSRPLGG